MGGFFAELKRRQMFRVAAAYAVVAWLLLQVVNNVAPVLDLPVWVARAFLLALVIGFPIALLFVWMRDLASADASAPKAATTKLDYVLAGALIVVIALVSYQQLAPSSGSQSAQKQADVAPAAGGISIAVLPFSNVSGDAEQEFFSDGMTDEIISALAKIPSLRVVGRTSTYQFRNNKDIDSIRNALGVGYVIDGSVRKAGNRVRITAQLIKTDDRIGAWTNNYDRELTDIFAIQEEIATAIATSLQVPLGLRQGESLVPDRTRDLESYESYLRARALVRSRGRIEPGGPLTEAAGLLESIVARDPAFAPAWALLAQAYAYMPLNSRVLITTGSVAEMRRVNDEFFPKAESAAQRAIQLDPNSSDGHLSLALVEQFRGKFLLADDSYAKSLALDPNNPDTLNQYSYHLAEVTRIKESVAMRQRLQALEPFVPRFNDPLASFLWLDGQTETAIAMYEALPLERRDSLLAQAYAAAGRYAEAADSLQALRRPEFYPPGLKEVAVRLLRTAPAAAASPQSLPRLGGLEFVYLHVGAPERAFEYEEDYVDAGFYGGGIRFLWHPSYAPARKTERFKALMRKAGLVDYWRVKGWPDLCRPVGADDFVCE